ncbi:YkgJ family cysteine cluster protein [Sphingomonas sp. CGMCC 1.13654]|uniref:YkgJ family cysteine cluster protein n=1 Tax=Sphingomonas chungangi TaxID=2683589 RepID=A0A838LA78_9SPHN|nr:YkgJ family cysteine cluster protein [Sphingomonas chungangi]MBA2936084.1 YkgJ family cysteine cluster protein [Sphingomonas chungangi]MVW55472.1 YkgJ family cysteine cluster protein [Sphingomonas chungangi]
MPADLDLEDALLGTVVAGRQCGGCTACCEILKIDTPDLKKPAGTPCEHRGAGGCAIHTVRPPICRAWFCGWRRIAAMPDEARPDRSGLMVSLDFVREPRNCLEGVSIVVRAIEARGAFKSDVAEHIVDLLCDRLVPVWLHDGSQKILIHPEGDVARHVISGDTPPAHLREEVSAWRSRYGMFA